MEHLVRPTSAASQPYETVPYICEKYDGGDFLTYPVRAGKPHMLHSPYDLDGSLAFRERERQHPTPTRELDSFFQAWLFFGLIHEILGDLCTADDFVRTTTDGDSKVITTSQLPTILDKWIQEVQKGDSKSSYEHVAECLHLMHDVLRVVGSTFDPNLLFSLISVGELLEYASNKAFLIENLSRNNRCPGIWRTLLKEPTWPSSMQEQGWCPSQVAMLLPSTCPVQLVYFLTRLSLPDAPERHLACHQHKCTAHQINPEKYKTRHFTANCDCESWATDVCTIDSILKDGRLPLLRISPRPLLADLTVEIIASRPSSRYVALSHVWADGLGNPTENALPRCQLRYLHDLVQHLDQDTDAQGPRGDLLLWCDTLCCPVAPKQSKDRALTYMRKTYEDASRVLVLDTSLQRYNSVSLSPEEICARIIASGWMRRLWTLQEGWLPGTKGRLWFQFCDKAVGLQHLWQNALDTFRDQLIVEGIVGVIISHLLAFTTVFRFDLDGEVLDLALMDHILRFRSVSVSSDEPILIGNLLGLPVEKILDNSVETRIHRMWSLMDAVGIPKSILFRLGPRLQTQAFRWAPSTMLFHESTNNPLIKVPKGDNRGVLSPRGLRVNFAGYAVSWPIRPGGLPSNPWNIVQNGRVLYMRSETGVWYCVGRRVSNTFPSEGDFLSSDNLNDVVRHPQDLYIIHLETDFQARHDGAEQTIRSLLVKLIEEKDNIKYVQSYMHLQVSLLQAGGQCMFEAAYRCAQQVLGSDVVRQLAELSSSNTDTNDPHYRALLDTLQSEILQRAVLEENEAALAVAKGRSGTDGAVLFGAITAMLFIGHYANTGAMSTELQRWCVD